MTGSPRPKRSRASGRPRQAELSLEILTRLLWSALIVLLAVGGFRLANRRMIARVKEQAAGLKGFRPGVPAILYFTTPGCIPCKTVQRPAIASLQAEMQDGLQVIEIDCTQEPEIAEAWGVLSVPTTFIIDGRGRARGVNHGVARAEALKEQISGRQ